VTRLEQVVAVHEKKRTKDHPDRLALQAALAGAYQAKEGNKRAVALLNMWLQCRKKHRERTIGHDLQHDMNLRQYIEQIRKLRKQ
jgi:hypothetical protein